MVGALGGLFVLTARLMSRVGALWASAAAVSDKEVPVARRQPQEQPLRSPHHGSMKDPHSRIKSKAVDDGGPLGAPIVSPSIRRRQPP